MATFANAFPLASTDGILYASAFVLTGTEVDIANRTAPPAVAPFPVVYGQAVLATFTILFAGAPDTASVYIIMQTSEDNSTWIDVAGIVSTDTSGTDLFAISGGAVGANALQQTRAVGSAPSANFSNQFPLGGLVRFVGKKTFSGGTAPTATVTLRYKLLGLR